MPPPDLCAYIPVICKQEDSKYYGKCFMEAIAKVRELNGVSVSTDRCLQKSDFSTGDRVVVRFQGKNYAGVVDLSEEAKTTLQRVESPRAPDQQGDTSIKSVECPPAPQPVVTAVTDLPITKKRKREDVVQPSKKHAASQSIRKRRTSVPGTILAGSSYKSSMTDGTKLGAGPTTVTTVVPNYIGKGTLPIMSSHTSSITKVGSEQNISQVILNKLDAVSARLEVSLLREEATSLRLVRVIDMIEMLSRDIQGLRSRQDLLFRKQDILQSTLAGEVHLPRSQRFRPCSTSSVLAWSSEPSSPTFLPPANIRTALETPPLSVNQNIIPQYTPVYAPPAQSLVGSHSVRSASTFLSDHCEDDIVSVATHSSYHNPAGPPATGQPSSHLGQLLMELDVDNVSSTLALQETRNPSQQDCYLQDIQLSELSSISETLLTKGPFHSPSLMNIGGESVHGNLMNTGDGGNTSNVVCENQLLTKTADSSGNVLLTNTGYSLPMNTGIIGNPPQVNTGNPPPRNADVSGNPLPINTRNPPPRNADVSGNPLPINTRNPPPRNTDVSGNPLPINTRNPPPRNTDVSGIPLPITTGTRKTDVSGNPLPINTGHPLLAETSATVPDYISLKQSGAPMPLLVKGGNPSEQTSRSPMSQHGDISAPSADDAFFHQVFTKANLVPVSAVFEAKSRQGKHLSFNNVGRFGVLLARCCFFGDDVLQMSTLKGKGKGNRPALDANKLNALMMEIHQRPPFLSLSMDDFNRTVKVKIEQSLRDYLKPSGAISKKSYVSV